MRKVTKEEYEDLHPRAQGYIFYMQVAWNDEISKECPYAKDSKDYFEFFQGEFQAILEVQDSEE